MSKFTHDQLADFTEPVSDTEADKIDHAVKAVKDALNASDIVFSDKYRVFGQGSYANRTNIKRKSDVDINVCYTDAFYFKLPTGYTREDFDFNSPATYSFSQYKNDIEQMLKDFFGKENVKRKNKCLHVKSNTYRVECDVVPTWTYKRYDSRYTMAQGVKLISDSGGEVINYPEQHIENGKTKNANTSKRFKSLARILKNLKHKMKDDGFYCNDNVSSFLLECLAYNLPDTYYHVGETLDWNKILYDGICYWYNASKDEDIRWKSWTEVSGQLKLMCNHKWSNSDVNMFMLKLWNYLEYKS